jgi:hypothetical protein
MADAAQQYQEIIARVPWVSNPDEEAPTTEGEDDRPTGGRQRSRTARGPVPYLLGTTVVAASLAVIAVVGLVAGSVRGTPTVPSPPVSPGAAPLTQAAAEPVTTPVVPVARQVFSGAITGSKTSLAVVVDDRNAAAYLCDGQMLEAWFEGEVVDGRVSLIGRNGAVLNATLGDRGLSGTGSAKGAVFDFDIAPGSAPAGVYEAKVNLGQGDVRMGWAVLPGGQQVGIESNKG